MKKKSNLTGVLLTGILLLSGCTSSTTTDEAITLNSGGNSVMLKMPGTATFDEYGTMVAAIEDNGMLEQKGDLTFEAGVMIYVPFDHDEHMSGHGQIWNITEENQTMDLSFYDNDRLVYSYQLNMEPLHTYHVLTDYTKAKDVNRVVVNGIRHKSATFISDNQD